MSLRVFLQIIERGSSLVEELRVADVQNLESLCTRLFGKKIERSFSPFFFSGEVHPNREINYYPRAIRKPGEYVKCLRV